MTDQPPPETGPDEAPPPAPDSSPAHKRRRWARIGWLRREREKKEKRKRTLIQSLAFFGGIGVALLIGVVVLLLVGGRFAVLSPGGRDLVMGFVTGTEIGPYGTLDIEGLEGDLFDDFTIRRATVTDAEGVWLEARNIRVDWSYWPLVLRRFHASEIDAELIRVIRRPIAEQRPEEPSQPSPLSFDIDRFSANIELMEDFSQEYGRWNLAGEANIPRIGLKTARVEANSLSRPGDFLRANVTFGEGVDELRVDAQAQEAAGGPLAGSLGYSPDQPFLLRALVDGEVVDAVVRTGEFTPLTVSGRYGAQGSRISGYFDFSGSDLLQPFVERIGRTARFGFATIPAADTDFQGVAWRLMSENFNSRAQGLIRLADQSAPDGIEVEVTTPNLSRMIGSPVAGPAAWVGTFVGDAQRWTLDGAVSLQNANLASYRAQRIMGPLTISAADGRFDVVGDIVGRGGSGEGIIGGLLGSQPRVQLDATRMADGAVLLNRVTARGQALLVDGQGSRNLGGGLSFRGDARVTDLSRIQPGASGAFGGPIRAAQAEPGAPWTLNFDGRGARVVTGMDELDRLLGRTPRLQLVGNFNEGRITVDRAELTAANARAGARGLIEPEGRLRLALDWNATGPFGVGPVEIDGDMSGEGALTGTLAQPRADLTAEFDRIAAAGLILTNADLTLSFRKGANSSDGRIAVTSGSNYGPARASGDFFLTEGGVRLSGVDLDAGGVTAQGDVALTNGVPASADLSFTAGPGAFIQTGEARGRVRLTEGAGSETAILDVTATNLRPAGQDITIRNLALSGRGTLSRLPFTLVADVGGDTPVQFDGSGVYSRQGDNQSVTLQGAGEVRDIAFETRSPLVAALAGDGRVVRVDLGVGGGFLTGEFRQDSEAANIQANLDGVQVGAIAPDLRGRVTGQVSLRGAGSDLGGTANVTLAGLRSVDGPEEVAIDGTINARLQGDSLAIQAQAEDAGAVRAVADVVLPVEASAAPLRLAIARTRAMSGDVSIQGQVQPLWDVFFGGERTLAGRIDAEASLGGTLNAPRLNGRLNVADGAFRDSATGLRLERLQLTSRFDDTIAVLESLTATDGGPGTVTGSGRLGLRQGSASSLQLDLANFRVIDNELAEARGSGEITALRAEDGAIRLDGELRVDEAEISTNDLPGSNGIVRMDVIEVNKPGVDPNAEPDPPGRPSPIALNIDLTGREIFVRGRGLDVELSLRARVRGTIAEPQLTGTARVVRGDYEFAGKRFVFDDAGTIALSTDPERIRLNLRAEREDPALTAVIVVTGTAASPEIELTSTPELPQDEILSQVLFGRSASQLSAFEAAQLASGVASLAGGGGFDVIGNIRELAGLDRLSFGGEASSLTVAGGRYLTDDIYFEIIGGGEGGGAARVEWQVRRNIAVESQFGGDGEATLSIRWRRESRPPGGRRDRRPNRD
ncbi:translocation/assembly module TamB domain-containing protein [Brevundimonas lutea]|uniref:translocation/assembly module TamB domain-containing protein n=1 Tax=Brevundimonas lutea TaxID=2293980 RepID=UPI001F0CD8AE|nr:translocation/assembly module TamB domain-containing protein [Brevundimonas lutea]